MSDAWRDESLITNEIREESEYKVAGNHLVFEDNFVSQTGQHSSILNSTNKHRDPEKNHEPLPDSVFYLKCLERKLQAVQNWRLVDALEEKRQSSLRALLEEDDRDYTSSEQLDNPIVSYESSGGGIYRHIRPRQPLSYGETVNLVKYDHLEQGMQEEP